MSRYVTIDRHRKDGEPENWWYSPLFGYREQIEVPTKHTLGEPEKYHTQVSNQSARIHQALRTTTNICNLVEVFKQLSGRSDFCVMSTYNVVCLNDDYTYSLLRTTYILSTPDPRTLNFTLDQLAWVNHNSFGFDIVGKAHVGCMSLGPIYEVAIVIKKTIQPEPNAIAHLRNDGMNLSSKLQSCAVIFIKEK
jgi:hypothetical protein